MQSSQYPKLMTDRKASFWICSTSAHLKVCFVDESYPLGIGLSSSYLTIHCSEFRRHHYREIFAALPLLTGAVVVVKLHATSSVIGLPAESFTPVVMITE